MLGGYFIGGGVGGGTDWLNTTPQVLCSFWNSLVLQPNNTINLHSINGKGILTQLGFSGLGAGSASFYLEVVADGVVYPFYTTGTSKASLAYAGSTQLADGGTSTHFRFFDFNCMIPFKSTLVIRLKNTNDLSQYTITANTLCQVNLY